MKKLACAVLAGVLLLGFCTGCNQTKLTREEVTAIVKETYERYSESYSYFLFPCTKMSVDLARTLPDDTNMLLVTDERFENIQAVRDFLATLVTDEFIQKHHPHVFYDAYLPNEPKDFTNENYTIYYEQDGRLYANRDPMLIPPGSMTHTDWDRATVISQTTQEIVAEYPLILTVYPDKYSADFKEYGTVRYVIKKVNNAWVLDDVIETPAPAFTTTTETTSVTTAATTPMSDVQKVDLQNFLNDKANNGFIVYNYYDSPEKISLWLVFYDGAGVGTRGTDGWGEEEKKNVLAVTEWEFFYTSPLKLPKKGVERVLQEKIGLLPDDFKDSLDEIYTYIEKYDAYYTLKGDTNYTPVTITDGYIHKDGTYVVDYKHTYSEECGVLTVRKTDTGYRFVSNVKK